MTVFITHNIYEYSQESAAEEPARQSTQPYLVAEGSRKNAISRYYVCVDTRKIPIETRTPQGAFDTLFKAHFVFHTKFDSNLLNFYEFLQAYYYKIPREDRNIAVTPTPRMREVEGMMDEVRL